MDAEIERLVLEALEPDRVALALGALEQLERNAVDARATMEDSARAGAIRSDAGAASIRASSRRTVWWRGISNVFGRRNFGPSRRWSKEFEAWRRGKTPVLTTEDRREILALGEDLPRLWSAPTRRTLIANRSFA